MSKGREDDAFGSDDVDEEEDDDVEDDDVEEVAEEEDRSQDHDPPFVRVRAVEIHADISQGSMCIPTSLAKNVHRAKLAVPHLNDFTACQVRCYRKCFALLTR